MPLPTPATGQTITFSQAYNAFTGSSASAGSNIALRGTLGYYRQPSITSGAIRLSQDCGNQAIVYIVTSNPVSTVSEGASITFTIITYYVANGTTLYYELSGINTRDLDAANYSYQSTSYTSSGASGYANIVNKTYLNLLGRYPESQGTINYYVNNFLVNNYTSLNGFRNDFTGSSEYASYENTPIETGTIVVSVPSAPNSGGSVSKTFLVVPDYLTEGVETVTFKLRTTSNTSITPVATTAVNISDTYVAESAPTISSFSSSTNSFGSGGGNTTLSWSTSAADVVRLYKDNNIYKHFNSSTTSVVESISSSCSFYIQAWNSQNTVSSGAINITVSAAPTYSLSRSTASVNEGSSFSITFSTNQGGSFAYTITGVSSSDIGGASLTGTVSNGSVLNYTATADSTTEGAETFTISLDNGQASTSVTINDTSTTPAPTPTYSLSRSTASVNEGSSFSITFSTNQGGSFAYTITGVSSSDIGGASLTGTVSNGSVLNYTATADSTTEGAETFNISLDNGQASTSVTINDTSTTPAPTYSLSRSTASVNEGSSFSITFSTNQGGSFAYTITGVSSSDIGGASLTGTVSNGSVLNYTATADSTTEGTETFNISLDNGQASTSVTINDTSTTPAPTPTYSLSRSTASVNEGGSFSITFSTNQGGSFAYTITGVSSSDIGGASLTGTVSNGSVLNYTATADSTTEGTETFNISLDNGQASTSVTINDTSTTPAPSVNYVSYSIGNAQNPIGDNAVNNVVTTNVFLVAGQTLEVTTATGFSWAPSVIFNGWDSYIRLVDSSGNTVIVDDDTGGNLSSYFSYSVNSTGTYTIKWGAYSGRYASGTGAYRII